MANIVAVTLRSVMGIERTKRVSRSGLARKRKDRLVSLMGDLGMSVPRYLEDYTKADLIDMIWDYVN